MTRDISEFELLLRERGGVNNRIVDSTPAPAPANRVVAEKSCSIDEFIEMVAQIVSKTLGKKYGVEFQPDEGARIKVEPAEALEHPYITYSLLNMAPKNELKPRFRENIKEKVDDARDLYMARPGRVYGQKMICHFQFNVIAGDYKVANEVIKIFEELIFNYTAFFKRNGVSELLYERRYTDTNLDMYRQSTSVRSVQYYVELERLYAEFNTEFDGISFVKD